MPLIINIHAIKFNKANELSGSIEATAHELDLDVEAVIWPSPINIQYRVINAGAVYLFEAEVSFQYCLQCSRCLAPITESEKLTTHEQFARRAEEMTRADVLPVIGDEIDIGDSIRDLILLAIPVQPLCSLDCAGLCPLCGADKNKNPCACQQDNFDPRLAALKKLLK